MVVTVVPLNDGVRYSNGILLILWGSPMLGNTRKHLDSLINFTGLCQPSRMALRALMAALHRISLDWRVGAVCPTLEVYWLGPLEVGTC